MKKTPLYDEHISLGARMAEFGGFAMPIQYRGIMVEHEACRGAVALFDTCHMGQVRISGAHAVADLDGLVSSDVSTLAVGRCRYGLMCNEAGGVIDDLIFYRVKDEELLVVVNAGTQEADVDWFRRHVSADTSVEWLHAATAKVDIQGPGAPALVRRLLDGPLPEGMRYFSFCESVWRGAEVMLSRTGYTGELGFELYCAAERVVALWRDCLLLGAVPAGLGARDTLRLEAGLPLYGHELSSDRNAAQAGLSWCVSSRKEFVGSGAIATDPGKEILTGIRMEGRRAVRAGDTVVASFSDTPVGVITSGSFAPSAGCAIALAYVEPDVALPGTPVEVVTSRSRAGGHTVKRPFVDGLTARNAVEWERV